MSISLSVVRLLKVILRAGILAGSPVEQASRALRSQSLVVEVTGPAELGRLVEGERAFSNRDYQQQDVPEANAF